MTRSEQAYVKRLEKRNEELFVALAIIKTWLSFPDDATTRCYHIGKLVEEKIQVEQAARAKEGDRK